MNKRLSTLQIVIFRVSRQIHQLNHICWRRYKWVYVCVLLNIVSRYFFDRRKSGWRRDEACNIIRWWRHDGHLSSWDPASSWLLFCLVLFHLPTSSEGPPVVNWWVPTILRLLLVIVPSRGAQRIISGSHQNCMTLLLKWMPKEVLALTLGIQNKPKFLWVDQGCLDNNYRKQEWSGAIRELKIG